MLAHPSKGIEALLARLEDMEFVSEYKYDGERAQVYVHSELEPRRPQYRPKLSMPNQPTPPPPGNY